MPTKQKGDVIAVVREDREMWEAAKLQLDSNLANLVFLVLLTFGGWLLPVFQQIQTSLQRDAI